MCVVSKNQEFHVYVCINSLFFNMFSQRALLEAAKEKMNEAISAKLSLDLISDRFCVADFGCASGPNTFAAVQNIIDAVEDKYRKETGQNPEEDIEFQVLFNDFTNNDFNTLFQALPAGRRYYTVGVPGSFFGRVLPKQSFFLKEKKPSDRSGPKKRPLQ